MHPLPSLTTCLVAITFFTASLHGATIPHHHHTTKPTIVIIGGNWTPPSQFSLLLDALSACGYKATIKAYPSQDSSNACFESLSKDTAFIRDQQLMPEVEAGHDVVLLMHSYGGHVGPLAAQGLSKRELSAQGKPGGIIGMVMLAAFLSLDGESLLGKLPNSTYPEWITPRPYCQLCVEDPPYRFYNDLSPADQQKYTATFARQSRNPFEVPAGAPAWADNNHYDKRRVYLHTTLDHAITLDVQKGFIANSGVEWDVRSFAASHAAFISHPKEIAEAVVRAARRFQGLGNR